MNVVGPWADLSLGGPGWKRRCWAVWAVRVKAGAVVGLSLIIWSSSGLASGSFVGVTLGPGRCYRMEVCTHCAIGQMLLHL